MTVRPVPGLPSTTSNRFTSSLPKIICSCHCHILPKNISPLPKIICLCHCHILPKYFLLANNHLFMPLPYLAKIYFLLAKIICPCHCHILPIYIPSLPKSFHCHHFCISFCHCYCHISTTCQNQSFVLTAI